jgi:hypothetical protein
MNSCPTRCAFDIAPYARSTHAAGAAVDDFVAVDPGGTAVLLCEALAEVLEVVPGGVLPAEDEVLPGAEVVGDCECPFPQAATATSRPAASAPRQAPWRRRAGCGDGVATVGGCCLRTEILTSWAGRRNKRS